MRPGNGVRPRALLFAAAASALTLSACTEDPLALDAEDAPGATSPTLDLKLLASELPTWRDTTYSGFVLPSQSGFRFVSNTATLNSRVLATLNVADTVRTFSDTLPAQRYDSVSIRVSVDTVGSVYTLFPVTFKMVALTQAFEQDSTTWLQAGPGRPWMTAGGDLGPVLATSELTEVSDSIRLTFDVSEDSIMKAWRASDGEPGFALVVEGPETLIDVRSITFRYDALLEGREFPVAQVDQPDTGTFITDPTQPPIGLPLRMGGLPATRFYIDFDIPASIEGVSLKGAIINHAELVFRPLPSPDPPFPVEDILESRLVKLLADPFVYHEKTPIGTSPLTFVPLSADSLAAGRPLRYDITLLILQSLSRDDPTIRLGFRGDPDGQTFGFWEFGSIESTMQPELRIILTPPPKFEVPG